MSQEITKRLKIMASSIATEKPTIVTEKPPQVKSSVQPNSGRFSKPTFKSAFSFEAADILLTSLGLSLGDYEFVPIMISVVTRMDDYCTYLENSYKININNENEEVQLDNILESQLSVTGTIFAHENIIVKILNEIRINKKIEIICSLKIEKIIKANEYAYVRSVVSYITGTGLHRKE